jgi:tetratricopeptide (TPR) repeat protein
VASDLLQAERLISKGQSGDAETILQSILVADSKHLGAMEMLSKLFWKSERYSELEQISQNMIALNPFEPGYFSLRGMALRALGRYGEAAKCLARDPAAEDLLRDLEAFQVNLVRDLISTDPVFATSYSQDPERAMTTRGFHFESREEALQWVSEHTPVVRSYARLA